MKLFRFGRHQMFFPFHAVVAVVFTVFFAGVLSAGAGRSERVEFKLDEPSDVSVAVYDGDDRMVRELARAVPMDAGKHAVQWDGLDREGQPVPPGEYTWKLLSSQGLETEYVMSLGTSVGFNHWPAVHGGPSAVTVHGDTMYMAGAGSEAAMGIAAADLDGTFVWAEHSLDGWGCPIDAAVANDTVWYCYWNSGSIRAASQEDGTNLKRTLTYHIPVRSIDLAEVETAAYDAERGFGWTSTEGLSKVDSVEDAEVNSLNGGYRYDGETPKDKVSFKIDFPDAYNYQRQTTYSVRLYLTAHFGEEQKAAKIEIQRDGTRVAVYDTEKSGIRGSIIVGAAPLDGQFELTFCSIGNDAQPLSFTLHRIEIAARSNRMDANDAQMVVTAAGSETLLWVDPATGARDQLPEYVEVGIPNKAPFHVFTWDHDGGIGGLQNDIPGSFPNHNYFRYLPNGKLDLSLNFKDKRTHQLALYFDQNNKAPHQRSMRVQILDAETGEVLDTRDMDHFGEGVYATWNVNRDVIVRITSTGAGGPTINALFFDPSSTELSPEQPVQFVGLDRDTHGYWQGQYGRDGKLIFGNPSTVEDSALMPDILQDVAIRPDGSIIAICGNDLVTLSRSNKTPVIRVQNLESPDILAVDQESGDILVFQAGDSQQVLRFDADFNLINTYGRYGGRREGRYIATDFAGVADIASDNRGGFLVAEWMSAPRRTAYFNRAGDVQHEWYGGQMFYYSPGIDPEDPSRVWLNSQFGWLFEMKVDYESKTYEVVSTWDINKNLDPVLFQKQKAFWIWTQPLTIQGERYLAYEGAHALLFKPDYENGRLVPVAAASVARAFNMGGEAQLAKVPDDHPWKIAMQQRLEASTKPYEPRLLRQFGYVDRNGDLEMQPDEFILDPDQPFSRTDFGSGSFIDKDLTAWRSGSNGGEPIWYRIPASDTLENGLPVWSYADKESGPQISGVRAFNLLPAEEGHHVYLTEIYTGDGFSRWWRQTYWEGHGFGWPATMINECALVKRNMDGDVIWKAGSHHSGFPGPKGRLDLPWRIAGKVDDIIGMGSQTRQPGEFFNTDGLYIGGVLDKRADDGLPPRVYSWWRVDHDGGEAPENIGILRYDLGQSAKIARAPDGGILFFGSGRNNVPVYRINGFDTMEHQTGTLQIKESSSAAAGTGTGLKAEYFANAELAGEPAASRTDADVWFGFAANVSENYIPWPEPDVTSKPFSVRWTGLLEPRFTEDTVIGFYDRDSGVRVWINDELVIDDWEDNGKKEHSAPIALTAGEKVPIRIEWRQVKDKNPEAHLVWESLSQPIAHVAGEYLYRLGE